MPNKFLVIGSNSFSGANMVDHLLTEKAEVTGISRSDETHEVFLPYKSNPNLQNFSFYQCDLNNEYNKLFEIIAALKPEYVINFAAQGMVAQSWKFPVDWYQTNIVSQVRLHEFLRQCDWLKKYVHVTTPEAYGSTDGWIKEHFNFAPSTPYAVSRAGCDLHLMSFFKAYNFPVVFTRAANVYGAGQQLYRIIPRVVLFARLGKKMELHGGGLSTRSFIHIRDVASATHAIALNGKAGESFHISTKNSITIRALVEMIADRMNVKFSDLVNMTEDRLGKDQAYLLDSEKIRAQLNWEDKVSLQKGIDDVTTWIDSNLEELKALPFDYVHKP